MQEILAFILSFKIALDPLLWTLSTEGIVAPLHLLFVLFSQKMFWTQIESNKLSLDGRYWIFQIYEEPWDTFLLSVWNSIWNDNWQRMEGRVPKCGKFQFIRCFCMALVFRDGMTRKKLNILTCATFGASSSKGANSSVSSSVWWLFTFHWLTVLIIPSSFAYYESRYCEWAVSEICEERREQNNILFW